MDHFHILRLATKPATTFVAECGKSHRTTAVTVTIRSTGAAADRSPATRSRARAGPTECSASSTRMSPDIALSSFGNRQCTTGVRATSIIYRMQEGTPRPPVDEHTVSIFDGELLHQWQFIVVARRTMCDALRTYDNDTFWFGLDAALGAIGNMSKVFWPPRNPRSDLTVRRCEHMRVLYEIKDTSLLKDRAIRNAFEHFDERIDTWNETSIRHNFADRCIAGPNGIVGLDPGDYARFFDPETNRVSVMGDEVDFRALVSEAETVGTTAVARLGRATAPSPDGVTGP